MCNLNILVRKSGLTIDHNMIQRITGFLMGATSMSFSGNDDGDGVYFNSGTLQRQLNKINFVKYRAEVALSNVIVSHQRITTSGKAPKYTQPFLKEGFVLAHNGIMREYESGDISDTYNFFERFVEEFKKVKSKKRNQKIKKALHKCLNSRSGRYSIAVYDIKQKCLYYVKESSTSINWFENENFVYLSTSSSTEKLLPMLKQAEFRKIEVKSDMLYKITPKVKAIEVEELGLVGIHEPPKTEKETAIEDYSKRGLALLFDNKGEYTHSSLTSLAFPMKCDFCGAETNKFNEKHSVAVCPLCLEEGLYEDFLKQYTGDLSADWYAKLDDEVIEEEEGEEKEIEERAFERENPFSRGGYKYGKFDMF